MGLLENNYAKMSAQAFTTTRISFSRLAEKKPVFCKVAFVSKVQLCAKPVKYVFLTYSLIAG